MCPTINSLVRGVRYDSDVIPPSIYKCVPPARRQGFLFIVFTEFLRIQPRRPFPWNLMNCSYAGRIPPELGKLGALNGLSLAGNELMGECKWMES